MKLEGDVLVGVRCNSEVRKWTECILERVMESSYVVYLSIVLVRKVRGRAMTCLKREIDFKKHFMTAPDQFQVFWVSVYRGYCSLCYHRPEI